MKKLLALLVSFTFLHGEYQARDFSHLLGKVEGIDDVLLQMHFTLYKGYVKNTNTLIKAIKSSDTITYGALKRRFGWEFDGMVLHELYFENLSKTPPLSSKSPLYQGITKEFGSFEAWLDAFTKTGLIRGIGWVILYKDPKDGHFYNCWINEHDLGHLPAATPLVVMDVWEHAYITQFGLDRAKYIKTFISNINWDVVSKRLVESKAR